MARDLDAARRARDEERGEAPAVTFGGRTFALVSEPPVDALIAWDETKPRDFLALVFADPAEVEDFMALRPTWADLRGVLDESVGRPESPAS